MRSRFAAPLLAAVALLAGCTTTIGPTVPADKLGPMPARFPNAAFDVVLHRYVDERGLVDYTALQAHRGGLDRYMDLIAAYSPDATPPLFPTRDDALAYWLNAYNAGVLRLVLEHYPIASVADVDWWLPDKMGFFVLPRLTFGGATYNLHDLLNDVIRERSRDPRIHFALNCGSRGCPHLPRYAFNGDVLAVQLDQSARNFVAEERNVRIDHDARRVYLSSIFKWYREDFGSDLLAYIARYSSPERASELSRAAAYEIEFVPYDWRLNDQAGG